MNISFFNGKFIPHREICISPDDRGFLFADGVYEVVRWYGRQFLEIEGHTRRLKRSLGEIRINWPDADNFPAIAEKLIRQNDLRGKQALVYLQVTRGVAVRTHSFPLPPVSPTVYAFAKEKREIHKGKNAGINVMLTEDIRWSRCDIKSVALLPNTMGFQEALDKNTQECVFVRNGLITECSHSNIFFIVDDILYTHPESNFILAGITRKIILQIAAENGITIKEEPVRADALHTIEEAFIASTSFEITPVTGIDDRKVGDGVPGPVTNYIINLFEAYLLPLKG